MSKPSKNMPMPISSMMRRWNGPIGSRSSRLPEFTDDIICFPFALLRVDAALRRRIVLLVQPPLRRRVAVPIERLVMGRDHHTLGVEMVVEALGAEFAPHP